MENTCPCCALGSLLWDVRAAEAWHLPHPPVAPVSPPAPEPKDPAGKRPSLLLSICLPCAYKADPTWMSAPPRYHNPPPQGLIRGPFGLNTQNSCCQSYRPERAKKARTEQASDKDRRGSKQIRSTPKTIVLGGVSKPCRP